MSRELEDDELMATVILLPKNARKVKVKARLESGEKAVMKLNKSEIEQARKDYLSIDPDDNAFAVWTVNKEDLDKFAEETGGDIMDPEALEYYSKLHE